MKITVVLEAFVQTSYETYTHKYKTVERAMEKRMEALKDGSTSD